MRYRCNYQGAFLNLYLALNTTAFGMVRGFSRIQYVDSAALPWSTESLTSTLYITLANAGNITGNFTVMPVGCSGPDLPTVQAGPVWKLLAAGSSVQYFFSIGAKQDTAFCYVLKRECIKCLSASIFQHVVARRLQGLNPCKTGRASVPPSSTGCHLQKCKDHVATIIHLWRRPNVMNLPAGLNTSGQAAACQFLVKGFGILQDTPISVAFIAGYSSSQGQKLPFSLRTSGRRAWLTLLVAGLSFTVTKSSDQPRCTSMPNSELVKAANVLRSRHGQIAFQPLLEGTRIKLYP